MKISCLLISAKLERFVDEELSLGASKRVRDHVARCEDCAKRVRELGAVRASLRNMPIEEHDAAFWDEQWTVIRKRAEHEHPRLHLVSRAPSVARRSVFAGAVVAAALLVAVGGFLMMTAPDRQPAAFVPYIDSHVLTIDQQELLENHFANAQYVSVSFTGQ